MLFEDTITSLSELITKLSVNLSGINKPVWYRGQSISDDPLVPYIFRLNPSPNEMNLIKQFKQDAILFMDPIPNELHDWLFMMRHYGVPTRLLDWSESPLVAAYFAVNENEDKDAAIWILLPLELNKTGNRVWTHPEHLPSFDEDEFMRDYRPKEYDQTNTSALPIAFIAPRNSPRMISQLSVFTIHHRNRIAIEAIDNGQHVGKFTIPKEAKSDIKKELKIVNIDEFRMFPELDRLGKKLQGV